VTVTQIIRGSRRMVFFGGAGVSTESGIPDFRGAQGLYGKQSGAYSPEEMISHDFFITHPDLFFDFYRRNLLYPQAEPNSCHKVLAKWEKSGKIVAVVTQNVDGLHQKAGSRVVHELHGSVYRNFCLDCGRAYGLDFILSAAGTPRCACGGLAFGGLVKPGVVLYGEPLDDRVAEAAVKAISQADTLLVGGTSLTVYPGSGMIRCFQGDHLLLFNRQPTAWDGAADFVVREPIGAAFARIDNGL